VYISERYKVELVTFSLCYCSPVVAASEWERRPPIQWNKCNERLYIGTSTK